MCTCCILCGCVPPEHVQASGPTNVACGQDLVDEMGCELREYSWPDYWYVGSEDRLFDSNIKVSEACNLQRLCACTTALQHFGMLAMF